MRDHRVAPIVPPGLEAALRRTRFGQDDISSLPSRSLSACGVSRFEPNTQGRRERDVPCEKSGLHPSVQAVRLSRCPDFRKSGRGRLQSRTGRTRRANPSFPLRSFEIPAKSPLFSLFEQSKRMSKKEPGLAKRFLRAHTSAPKGPARPEGGYLAARDRLAKGFFRLVFLPLRHARAG